VEEQSLVMLILEVLEKVLLVPMATIVLEREGQKREKKRERE
jgi:hypothetical protein